MAKVSLNQASKDTGVSLPTLSRWRKKGLISADKTSGGGYLIDTSEYDRIAEIRKQSPNMKGNVKGNMKDAETQHETFNDIVLLQHKIEMLEQEVNSTKRLVDVMSVERNDWKKQAQTLLLQTSPQEPIETSKGFWASLFSKN